VVRGGEGPEARVLGVIRDGITVKAPGNASILNDAQPDIIDQGPNPAIHGVVRWRLVDLMQWVFEEFRLSISKQTMSRELRSMAFRKLSARPRHHAQDAAVLEAFKKTSPLAWSPDSAPRP
jgi:hypothetical protein